MALGVLSMDEFGIGDIVIFKDKELSEMTSFGIIIEQVFFDDYLGEFVEGEDEPWFLVLFVDVELILSPSMMIKII
jgi:hypothetical protein